MAECILQLKNVTKTYPGVIAVNHANLDFNQGEVHALVGENGAGKSTIIKMISGAIKPDEGEILLGQTDLARHNTHEIRKQGVEVVYQEFNLVQDLTVYENIFLGCSLLKHGILLDVKEMVRRSKELFDSLGIQIDPEKRVSELSVAYMQFVEIAKAISKNARVLIMDEPTATLTDKDVEILLDIVKRLREQGVTIIYVSHRMEEIFLLADRITVMRDGEKIITLNKADTSRKELIHHMVGREVNETYPAREHKIGEEVLRVEHLSGNGVKDISFSLHKGEILGFGGLVGSGRTETMEVLYGAVRKSGGKIFLNGQEVDIRNPQAAVKKGLAFVPEDRKSLGLIMDKSIKNNISLTSLRKYEKALVINDKKEKAVAEKQISDLRIKTPHMDQLAKNLSGGNQQKVVLGKWLANEGSEIFIFDEPTRGIDVGAKHEIYLLMNQLAEAGKSIIMISSEMEELTGMSDRIIVLCENEMAGELCKDEIDKNLILHLASGEK